jgi:hypothetical protein
MANYDKSVLGEALVVGDEIERLMIKILSSRTLRQDEMFEQFISAMAIRCLNFFRATLLLSRQGLSQPASVCVRCLVEQCWVFVAVAAESTRDDALKRLYEHSEYNRKKACDDLRKLPSNQRDQRITDEALSELEATLVAGKKHFVSGWATIANRSSDLTAYTLLCDRSHPSSLAIESHVVFDDSGRVISLTANPDTDSLPRDVLFACDVMIDVISANPDSWQTDDVVAEAIEVRTRLHKLWELVSDPFVSTRSAL